MTRRIAAISIAVGGILYAAWFIQWIVPTHLNAATSYISELSADNQPNRWVFRGTDLAAGILLVIGSIAALRSTIRQLSLTERGWAVLGWASLLLFGISTISDSQSPLPCAATAEAACERLSDRGELGFADTLHVFTTAGEDFFFATTMLCLLVVAWQIGAPVVLRRVALIVAILIVMAWAGTVAVFFEFELFSVNDHLGVPQRIEVTLMGVWLVVVSIAILRIRRIRTPRA